MDTYIQVPDKEQEPILVTLNPPPDVIKPSAQPPKRQSNQHKVKYHNVIITLLALMVMPVYLYGPYVLVLLVVGLVTALIVELICVKWIGRTSFQKHDYSSVATVLVTVMLMPATVPMWVVSVSIAIGLCVAKYPFGGTGHNIFNPAAVGVAFCTICWPEYMLRFPMPYTTYGLPDMTNVQYAVTPLSVLRVGGTPKIDFFDILLGEFSGPLGVTCMIVIVASMFYLMFRKVISKRIVFAALMIVVTVAVLFPRVITGRSNSILYELSAGSFLFGMIFMANDPTTMPKTKNGRIFYGALIGILVVSFRYFGKIDSEFVFAILIANVFANSCDRYTDHLGEQLSKMKLRIFPKHKIESPVEVGEVDA